MSICKCNRCKGRSSVGIFEPLITSDTALDALPAMWREDRTQFRLYDLALDHDTSRFYRDHGSPDYRVTEPDEQGRQYLLGLSLHNRSPRAWEMTRELNI